MLVTTELTLAAGSLRQASGTVRTRIDDTATTRSSISLTGFAGPAADAGLDRLADLARDFTQPAAVMESVAGILENTAAAQQALDAAKQALLAMAVPVPLRAVHTSALAALSMLGLVLDQACAAAIDNACRAEHEQDLERLAFYPETPLSSIHTDRLTTAPASVRETVEAADGIVLEGGPDGYTVMVGASLGPDGEPIPPTSVTTMVAGVGSGDPAKFAGAVEQARTIAATTGGAVVVWQGYSPPPNVPAGFNRAAAAAGADDLATFQYALQERFPESKKLVVGHSYGSVVAARAAEEYGLFADQLYLVGSPGVGADSAEDLTLYSSQSPGVGQPEVTVADASSDPIRLLRSPLAAIHGTDPGSARFGAEKVPGIRGGHTDYFRDEAMLRSLAESAKTASK